ncbi:hypothetical protein WKK05_37640 (plasmid) [Nostoc sp. UHCC 0302]|uniref:hypothetical protein n=1 Tax=Nostoc sp. UHCC 0302 TaxID=3134896 RepID=UPI00311CADE9
MTPTNKMMSVFQVRCSSLSLLLSITILVIAHGSLVKAATTDTSSNLPNVEQLQDNEQSFWSKTLKPYNDILKTYNTWKQSFDKYSKIFTLSQGGLSKEKQDELIQIILSTTGALDAPDPIDSGERIREAIAKNQAESFKTSPSTQGTDAETDWHRAFTYGQSRSVLGGEGQKAQSQEAQASSQALAISSQQAEAAQSDVVTQDILKKIALQNVQAGNIARSQHLESQKQSRALAAANINLADISKTLDGQSRVEDMQSNAGARQLIESAAQASGYWQKQ